MVKNHYRWDFIGLSTDTKPTPETSEKVVDGSTFYTSDNSKLYVWCKDNWYEKTVSGGGGGTSNFNQLSNRPKYNGTAMTGDTNIPEVVNSNFTGTDGSAAGTTGLVPAPATTDAGKFLKADGTWDTAGGGSSVNVVQTTGTSTTDVMSQKAVTDTLFYNNAPQKVQIGVGADSNTTGNLNSIAIGSSSKAKSSDTIAIGTDASSLGGDDICLGRSSSCASSTYNSVAIGRLSSVTAPNSVALGTRATATEQGQFDISTGPVAWGYNNSSYRLLTGLYDPQSAHDAATKGYVDTNLGIAKTLTTSDYNYDKGNTGSNNCVALWLLPSGLYTNPNNVNVLLTASYSINTANRTYLVSKSDSTLNDEVQIILFKGGTFADRVLCTMTSVGSGVISHYFITNTDVVDSLSSTDAAVPLSANQGRVLNDKITALEARVAALEGN